MTNKIVGSFESSRLIIDQLFPKNLDFSVISHISRPKLEAEIGEIFHALSRLKSAAFDGRAEPRPQVHKKANYVIIVQTQDIKSK